MNQEKKFISLVAYLHDEKDRVIPFFSKILPVLEGRFEQYELICVEDDCRDGTIERLKDFLAKRQASVMVNIVHMSFYHGLESSMNAGRDLAIGDFVYEFDSLVMDYEPELLLLAYERLLEGNDIVAAGRREGGCLSSRIFYEIYNFTRRGGVGRIGPETFRLISRRAANRIKTMGQFIPYRKAVYANCGLSTHRIEYQPVPGRQGRGWGDGGERISLALDSFIYFTNVMERLSLAISVIFLVFSVGMGAGILNDYLGENKVAPGWMSTMGFLAVGFFGVFALLTIILKYLSVLLNLVYRRQRYLISEIEKVVKE